MAARPHTLACAAAGFAEPALTMLPPMAHRRRHSTFRLLRAVWRYRGRIEAHGNAYQAELATAVRTALDQRLLGRTALGGYRLAMRLLLVGAGGLAVLAVLLAFGLWQLEPWLALLAVVPAAGAGLLGWWRFVWGAPLDWLQEHADPERTVAIGELPARLHQLARESRSIANVPARLGDELEALATDLEPPAR